MEFKKLGDWCKWLEKNFSPEIMIPTLPVIIRFDGNNFSKWTKGLNTPFDSKLHELMVDTTKFLVEETNACVGYTQSDEITIILYSDNRKSSIYHEGKKQKILSKLTAKVTQFFNNRRIEILPNHNKLAIFDSRIYQCPSKEDAVAQILWREHDAIKNSIAMLTQSIFSHKSLDKLNGNQMQNKLMVERNINWNDLLDWQKRGTYIQKIVTSKKLTENEIKKLPPLHNAHKNPKLITQRRIINEINMPILNKIENKVDVIFFGQKPILNN